MSLSNKELQLQRNCQLYIYVLKSQHKEIPEYIQECAEYDPSNEYNCLVDCTMELSKEIQSFDTDTFEKIVNSANSMEAQKLKQWWDMYQMYIPLEK